MNWFRSVCVVAAAGSAAILMALTLATTTAAGSPRVQAHAIHHVFVIVLENEGAASTFADPSADPYLAKTLPARGELLENYYAIGHKSDDNYIALISGQPPNPDTQDDCPVFTDFTSPGLLSDGVLTGNGCVYPSSVANIGTQLSARGLNWKAYEQDMGNDPARESATCGHPAVGAPDETVSAVPGDGYAARHDPFVYFHSVIDRQRYCDQHVVALGTPSATPSAAARGQTGLATDLRRAGTTPAFSFITPNLCYDGHDFPCINQPSGASALEDIDAFLETWVPKIMASAAYRQGGLLEITFDESETGDVSSCCHETPGPAAPLPGITGPGGGRVGALLLSPFIKPGSVVAAPYNHYSSLATWESLFGLPRLADARGVRTFLGPSTR
jgi:phosphatidylinositol-3-phosphatase